MTCDKLIEMYGRGIVHTEEWISQDVIALAQIAKDAMRQLRMFAKDEYDCPDPGCQAARLAREALHAIEKALAVSEAKSKP